jgi:integrase
MKNPNGYGSVYKLSGKRRKPWGVRKTIGWNDEGKQTYQNIGYYATRSEAMKALAAFNTNPYSIDSLSITFAELYDKWSEEKFPKMTATNIKGYRSAYKLSAALHDLKFKEIKKAHLQAIIDECPNGYESLKRIKILFNQIFRYAVENDILEKDYSKFVEIAPNYKETSRKPFTNDEIQLLWDNIDKADVDTVLIMIFTGLRPGELITIETANIDLENRILRGGIKTKAGKNRVVPLNIKIHEMVSKRVLKGYDYMIANDDGTKMSYYKYDTCKFKPLMDELGLNHKAHDCRHTFATLMDNSGANKLSIKRIMGHATKDLTDKIYIHKDIEQLKKAIDMI